MPRSPAASRWSHRAVLLVSLAVQVILALLAARIYLARHNTLQANGNWRTTKTELARGLNGAFSYFTGLQALAGGRLDLGAWHGFHEVVHRRAVDRPRRIEFDFSLRENAWVVALLDRDFEGRGAGVRISANPRSRHACLEIAPDGEFLAMQELPRLRLTGAGPHHADLRLEPDRVIVTVDGKHVGECAHLRSDRQTFGFRGGQRGAAIDNVSVTLASGARIGDDFEAPAIRRWVNLLTLPAVLAVNAALYLALRVLTGASGLLLQFRFLMTSLTLLAMAALLYAFVLLRSGWYPRLDAVLQEAEIYYEKGAIDRVLEEIRAQHGGEPEPGSLRVLFVGSSQTWGAGALRDDQTFVRVLEPLLNARRPSGPRIECINGGISSTRAATLERLLLGEWLALRPRVVVVNLSSNDRRTTARGAFSRSLERMIEATLESGACPVLVKEANAFGTVERGLIARHRELEEVGRAAAVPVIDMHRYLMAFEDRGFLWWDKVHLTPYGQRVVAEKLALELDGVIAELGDGGGMPPP